MDNIKESFQRVKEDIYSIRQEVANLKLNLTETRQRMIEICEIIQKIDKKLTNNIKTHHPPIKTIPSNSPTHNNRLEPLKTPNSPISTGNQGVQTDRQTDQQTDIPEKSGLKIAENSFENAIKILNSLDNLKKEIRLQFKRLTEQEILIFSTIYQIEEEDGYANYRKIAEKLNLTESSVRDYVGRLIQKGIPLEKKKINNKQIHLFISQHLKKIAPLSTILQLRDL